MSPPEPAVAAALDRLTGRHAHLCPRQVLGVRLGLHAGDWLGVAVPQDDKRLLAFVETDGCFADGVSAATGCWLGRRTLRLVDYGKAAVTVVDTLTERAVRLAPHPQARERALAAAPPSLPRWEAMLAGYQLLPAAELVRAEPVQLALDHMALISRPGQRVTCAVCGEEIMNEREVALGPLTVCRGCAGDRYYRATAILLGTER